MFTPITKKSVSDSVFEQLRQRILAGELAAGETLPSERHLAETLGVNRGAVREALKRLEQAKLITIHQGESTRVLDFWETAGTELISSLIFDADGQIDFEVARSVMEMRSAMAADIARLCAIRSPEIAEDLLRVCEEMKLGDLSARQDLNMEFWATVIRGSQNVAYQLAFNSIRELYEQMRELMAVVLMEELNNLPAHRTIAEAIGSGESEKARKLALELVSTRAPSSLVG